MSKEERVSTEAVVRDIRRQTRRKYSAEEEIRIVLEGLRGEEASTEGQSLDCGGCPSTQVTRQKRMTGVGQSNHNRITL